MSFSGRRSSGKLCRSGLLGAADELGLSDKVGLAVLVDAGEKKILQTYLFPAVHCSVNLLQLPNNPLFLEKCVATNSLHVFTEIT